MKEKIIKCIFCGNKENKDWVEISPGHKRLIYICCEVKRQKQSKNFIMHRSKEPVAFGYDKKTGQPLAMDKHGKTFDPGDTRYDLKHDRFGWGATDKIPKKKKYFI